MRSLMRENESERVEGWGGAGLRECKQITSNSVSDWLEREILRGREGGREGGMRGSAVFASRGCPQDVFPSSFIYFSYLFIQLSAGSAIGRAGQASTIFILLFFFPPFLRTSWGFPICAVWLAERVINLAKVELNRSPFSSSSSPPAPLWRAYDTVCRLDHTNWQ